MLPVGEKLLVVSEDEAFGEIVLGAPAKMNIRSEERRVGKECRL